MHLKALLACAAVAAAVNLPLGAAEQPGTPPGWTVSAAVGKQYEVGYDPKEGAVYLRSVGDPGRVVGALSQAIDPAAYRHKSVMLSAEVKVDPEPGRVELFLRATGGPDTNSGASWNTPKEWAPITVQMSDGVTDATTALDYGLVIQGRGRVWIRNVQLTVLADGAPKAHNVPLHFELPAAPVAPRPVNLGLRP